MRRALAALILVALGTFAASASAAPPPIKHVFMIVLENQNYATTFGPGSKAPYLATELPKQGQLLPNYYGTGHASLDNYISMISGQAPSFTSESDCQLYTDLLPGTADQNGQAVGQGCVYPAPIKTIADQLESKGLGWKGYMEDMGNTAGQPSTCRHPAINSQDNTQTARPTDQYAARHNPFVYFHSIIDRSSCQANDVPLTALPGDLASAGRTASYSFITPNLCHDGHDAPCANGEPGGLVSADSFLKTWVPRITGSPAFADGGLLIVTFDESGNDGSACCNEQPGPNSPSAGGQTAGPGGGKIGAVVISPYVQPGSVNQTPYNHYGLLRSIEDIFGLGHLGMANQAGLAGFGADVYNRSSGSGGSGSGGSGSSGGQRRRSAHLRLAVSGAPRGCVSARARFRVHARTTGTAVRTIEARLDGRRIKLTRSSRLGFNIHVGSLRGTRHKLVIRAVDRRGHATARTLVFRRCGGRG